ncbi:MAG TPA: diaminopimelate decarboxylase [Candidatus Angelobacter sp.]
MSSRPPGFAYRKGELYCEQAPLRRLADQYGTPLYVYSATAMRQRYHAFDQAFAGIAHTICYSVKANSNLSILRLLARLGAGFDIVSGGEMERVRLADKRALKKIVFSGVGKTADELKLALKAGTGILLFNVESESELELLAECAARLRKTANVALRINPDVSAQTHPYISTGLRAHKFGVPIGQACALYKRAAAHKFLRVAGVSLHIGSQITDVSPFAIAVQRAAELVRRLAAEGHKIKFLDAGGGLGISYHSSSPISFPDFVRQYAESIIHPLQQLGKLRPHLLLEPGRSIVAPAGVLLTRFLYAKRNGNKSFAIVDAAMNDLLRPALYQAAHEIAPVLIHSGEQRAPSDVVGPVCETGDFLAKDASLPPLMPGEYLCIFDAGAYGMALASNYNTRPRAAEILVEGAKARIIRRRESLKDLVQQETACL